MNPMFLMLGMQAAGMIYDYMGTENEQDLLDRAQQMKEAAINSQIQQTRLQTANDSLHAMQNLRQTLGSQIAVMAARGQSTGAGSAASILNESQANFNADEKMRNLNQIIRENQLKTGMQLSSLQNEADSSRLWQGFYSRTINRFPSTFSGWKQANADVRQSFGLTQAPGS